jgi:hypothetical protein
MKRHWFLRGTVLFSGQGAVSSPCQRERAIGRPDVVYGGTPWTAGSPMPTHLREQADGSQTSWPIGRGCGCQVGGIH